MGHAQIVLDEARGHFNARRGRPAVEKIHLACFLAAAALSRAVGFDFTPEAGLPPMLRSLAKFYQQLSHAKRRLDNDRLIYVNIEEVANWMRLGASFIERVGQMARKYA